MSPADMACVVLASGLSERFGAADKLAVDLCGKPVLSHVLDTAKAVGFCEVFCVAQKASLDGVVWVENKNPEKGQGHALRLGLQAAQEKGWSSSAVMLGDMPLVPVSHMEMMILESHEKQCLISICESVRMPPAIFNRAGMGLILSQIDAVTGREIFDSLNPAAIELDKVSALDVDTPEDLFRVEQVMKSRNL